MYIIKCSWIKSICMQFINSYTTAKCETVML